ncbi:hypothetical protein AAT22_10225 [Clostridium sp. C8]|nr:hypothetical protein AAT22_10225 [Clostridium sp. C8]
MTCFLFSKSKKKHSLNIILDADISALMDSVLTNKLIKTEAGDLVEMVEAKVINKETTTVAL